MSKLIDWINQLRDNEEIEAIQIGDFGWGGGYKSTNELEDLTEKYKGKIVTENEISFLLNREFDDWYGRPECNAILVYTKNWIISVSQYDGSTNPFAIPRNPKEGFIPYMPGG